ncbi:MAG: ROK family protein [Eubacteriales bacterium]
MYTIGIDLGGTNIAAGIVDSDYKIIAKDSIPTNAKRPADEITADIAGLCRKLVADAKLTMADIAFAGMATPGTANGETGIIEYANNLPFFMYPMCEKLSGMLDGTKVYIENDANAAAKAEAMAGVAKDAKYSVMITLGTGVGGGIVLNGQVYAGFNFAGAELGHIVIEKDGRPCSCGRRGCWEAYSSATGLINMTRDKLNECRKAGRATVMEKMIGGDLDRISGKTAFAAARQGDAAGAEVVDEYIDYLACGIANIINIFQPDVLSIGGGICHEGDYLLKPLNERVFKEVYTKDREPKTKIMIASLGNDAGIIGAAALGR